MRNHSERIWLWIAVTGMLLIVAGFTMVFGAPGAAFSAGVFLLAAALDAMSGGGGE